MRITTIILTLLLAVSGLFGYVGKITALKGNVMIQRGGEQIRAVIGSDIEENDNIITNASSVAQLYFKDETVVSIGKNSTFRIEGFFFDGDPQNSANNATFNAVKGAFKVMTGKIGKISPKSFRLSTRTATIGIRGTHFLGNIASESDQIACTDGKIVVGTLDGQGEVLVKAGQITFVIPGEIPTPPREFTADELKSLAKAATNGNGKGAAKKEESSDTGDGDEDSEGDEGIAIEETIVEDNVKEVTEDINDILVDQVQKNWLSGKPPVDFEFSWAEVYTDATAYYLSQYGGYYESVDEYISWFDNIQDAYQEYITAYPNDNLVVYASSKSVLPDNNEYTEWGTWELGYAINDEYYDAYVGYNFKGYYLKGNVTPASTVQTYISSNSEFTYNGSLVGSIVNSSYDEATGMYSEEVLGDIINSSSNLTATVNFGTGAINGSASFSTTNGETWNHTIDGTLSIEESYFNGSSYDTTNGNSVYVNGAFYGDSAQAIGGDFTAYDNATGHQAIGAFEAKR